MRQNVLYGAGRMPPVQGVKEEEIVYLRAFLEDESKKRIKKTEKPDIEGPVVAWGGAPAEQDLHSFGVFNRAGNSYPEGVEVPNHRYYSGYGLGRAYVIKPPWTSIVAYDLNKGTIKWRRPLGEDPHAFAAKGVKNTGVPAGSQRNGMIVTSNGIVFATVNNGKIYAYDMDNGNILWTGETQNGISSIPSMYEVDGRVYLVVSATTPKVKGWNLQEQKNTEPIGEVNQSGEYVVFALPQ